MVYLEENGRWKLAEYPALGMFIYRGHDIGRDALVEYIEDLAGETPRGAFEQVYYYFVPSNDGVHDGYYHEASEPGRGRFAVTTIYCRQ